MVIVLELSEGNEVRPVILPLIYEEPEVLLQLLVDLFCLAVSLWVVCRGGSQLDSKHPVEFPSELRYELGASI